MAEPIVLLVDDEESFRAIVAEELAWIGYRLEAAGALEEARARLAAETSHVVRLVQAPQQGEWPTLAEAERRHIRRVLEESRGHRKRAAKILGISERNLYRKLKGLDPEASR